MTKHFCDCCGKEIIGTVHTGSAYFCKNWSEIPVERIEIMACEICKNKIMEKLSDLGGRFHKGVEED